MRLYKAKGIISRIGFIILLGIILVSSCKKDQIFNTNPGVELRFSNDTIVFDTVFSTIGSITKRLMVYNTENEKIKISSIRLVGGVASAYRINIDGIASINLQDIEIEGGDSLFVFLRALIDPNDMTNPFVVTDQLEFVTNGNTQKIELVAWGQNAYYFLANRYIQGLPPFKIVAAEGTDTTWTNEKPIVVYGYAVVDSNAVLRINAGTHIHFHNNSGLWVYKGGSIKVNGTLEEPVIFEGDRLDPDYIDVPGQWDRIWLLEGSEDNEFNYAIIKNGFIGIQAETWSQQMGNSLQINNTRIFNMTGMGLFSRLYNIYGTNNEITNCGGYLAAFTMGGLIDFRHSTFANHWSYSTRDLPSLYMSNFTVDTNGVITHYEMNALFGNCIIDGRHDEEVEISDTNDVFLPYTFDHCTVKTELNIFDDDNFINCLLNPDTLFINSDSSMFQLRPLSPAIDKGAIEIGNTVPFDILGVSRGNLPDIGAYEFTEENK